MRNSSNQLCKAHKEKLINIILKHAPQAKIYLFGSRAREENHKGADIDLALDAGGAISRKIIWKIEEEIEDSTIP
ncbi:nucleotidyltransferase domain-containing protein, partial [Candidatus Dependentiae bacterium]|nr:nucleotidyltransferase domain-containing protein [Candidatus Dependentiae bacterium]